MSAFRRLGFIGDANPCISREAGRGHLARLFAQLGFTTGAEIGVWEGHYSSDLCAANPQLRLTCVDPWQEYRFYNEAKNNQDRLDAAYRTAVERLRPFGCTILRMTSEQGASTVPDGSLDFVYVDANHGEAFVRQDLEAWTPKVRSGGVVAGHDYIVGIATKKHKHIEVRAAVDAFCAERSIAPIYVLAKDKTPSFFWMQP